MIDRLDQKHILLVDDDQNVAQMLKLLLETRGYSVSIANSGRSAFEIAMQDIDIILNKKLFDHLDCFKIKASTGRKNS